MEDEKKEEEKSKDDEVVVEDEKSEDEASKGEGFEKDSESVPVGKYNQSVRKQRELEIEKKDLEEQLEKAKNVEAPAEKEEESEEDDDDDFFGDEKPEKKKEEVPIDKIIEDKVKPFNDYIANEAKKAKEQGRKLFFDKHPEYLDKDKFAGLMNEMDVSINPNSEDTHFVQLEKAHRIIAGEAVANREIEAKENELAGDAASGGSDAQKGDAKQEFTAEDRKHMEAFGTSEEGMRAYKKKIASGDMVVQG